MDGQRYIASPNLTATLADRERSRRWLALKIKVSPTLMTYVVTGERSLSAEKAELAAAVLGKKVSEIFVSTDASNLATELIGATA